MSSRSNSRNGTFESRVSSNDIDDIKGSPETLKDKLLRYYNNIFGQNGNNENVDNNKKDNNSKMTKYFISALTVGGIAFLAYYLYKRYQSKVNSEMNKIVDKVKDTLKLNDKDKQKDKKKDQYCLDSMKSSTYDSYNPMESLKSTQSYKLKTAYERDYDY